MKSRIVTALRYIVFVAVILAGFWYLSSHFSSYARRASFTPGKIALLVLLNLCTIACESVRLRIMIRKLGRDIGAVASWNMMTLMQSLNHVVLKAGTMSGGFYISKRYGISFTSYVAFVVTYVVVMVMGSGILGLSVSAFSFATNAAPSPVIPLFFTGVILVSAGMIVAARIRLSIPWLPRFAAKFLESVNSIYSDTGLLSVLLAVECVYHVTTALRFMTAVALFSGHVGFLESVVVITVGNFLRIATIVPGGLGIAEAASAWTAGIVGGDSGISAMAAGFDRVVYVFLVMVFGGIAFFTFTGKDGFRFFTRQVQENDAS
jgi:uncharacterized membrane protein YbhN (UPF0104 family)